MTQSATDHSNPFWIDEKHDFISSLETHSRHIQTQWTTNNSEYDIVIIGTGLSGVGCAYWLRKLYSVERFPRILLLEKNIHPCSGASGRNAGFLWPSYEYLAHYVEDLGYDNAFQWIEFQQENLRSLIEIAHEHKIDCELNVTRGNVALASNDQEWEILTKSYELVKDYINKHPKTRISLDNLELWNYIKCQQMVHSDKFIGGLFIRESGTIWLAKFVYGLLKYCLDQPGINLITQSKVVRIENSKNIILENGSIIIARQAIVHASNAYISEYVNFLRDKILPVRSQCSLSKPIETRFWSFGLSVRNEKEYYHQSFHNGRIIIGGCRWRSPNTEVDNRNDSELNELIRQEHATYFSRWYPDIVTKNQSVEIDQEWTGIMGFTIDHLPIIGPLPDDKKQFLICGYNGEIFRNDLFFSFLET